MLTDYQFNKYNKVNKLFSLETTSNQYKTLFISTTTTTVIVQVLLFTEFKVNY